MVSSAPSAQAAVTQVWRRESARLIAALTRVTRDLGLAEDLAQDALVIALEQWPERGIPDNPGAWLMTIAQRRSVDHFRRADTLRRKTEELGTAQLRAGLGGSSVPDFTASIEEIDDDVLRLIFLTCHPALAPEARAALTLRLVGGLTTTEIARGFCVKDATVGQRISRAKKTLTQVRASLDLPTGAERVARLDDVMAVIYLIFNEGYTATAGADWVRPELCTEAVRLARLLVDLMPEEAEAHGLQALLAIQASRIPARHDAAGAPVLLEQQDRSRWDQLLIRRGLAALDRAEAVGGPVGPYVLQAAIAAGHARAVRPEDTDWVRMARLYDLLATALPTPVVELNRAVAHGRAYGPQAGLTLLERVADDPTLARSALVPSVRGDLLERAGQWAQASDAFSAAAELTQNVDERRLLLTRARRLSH